MLKLLPLSILLIHSLCCASGHHRGEQDIELSASIMRFLNKIKEEPWTEYDDAFVNDPLEETVPLQRLSVSINKYVESSDDTKKVLEAFDAPPNTPEDEPKTEHSSAR